RVGDLGPLEELGDHADHLAAVFDDGVGQDPHEPDVAAAVDEADLAAGQRRAEAGGRLREGRRGARVGAAEDAQTGHGPRVWPTAAADRAAAGAERAARGRGWARVDGRSVTSGAMTAPDLPAAATVVDLAQQVVGEGVRHLSASGGPDAHQVLAYDLAHAAAAVETARSMLGYGALGDDEARLTCAFVADAVHDLAGRVLGREALWDVPADSLAEAVPFLTAYRDPAFLAGLASVAGPRHLDADFELVQDTFRAFAEREIAPAAEHVHRENGDVPEAIVSGLAEMGAFGLSVPAEYGGYSEGGDGEYLAMVVATEELSRASLGIGGSLITRPEILTRALVRGGTEEQKLKWLPKLASAEVLSAVAVTEPDFGSDVAQIKVTATPTPGPNGEPGYAINGVKTWCTFGARADALTLLARTDPDRSKTHRGLSLFIVPKERGDSHGFELTQPAVVVDGKQRIGKMEGRPIDTIGYRGMHSYEIALEDWWVPAANQIGGE